MLPDGRAIAIATGKTKLVANLPTASNLRWSDTSVVLVTNAPTVVDLTDASKTLASVNDTYTPPIILKNARGTDLSAARLAEWSSSDPTVLDVNPSTGVATALNSLYESISAALTLTS